MTAVRKARRHRGRIALLTTLTALAAVFVFALVASATQPAGEQLRDRDVDAGNSARREPEGRRHGPPALDWANVAEQRQADSPSGANDESFGQGTKEDTRGSDDRRAGSIPPQKSDLQDVRHLLGGESRRPLPEHVLAPRSGAERHDEHGLRVQPLEGPVDQRRHPGPHVRRRADPVRPLARRHEPDHLVSHAGSPDRPLIPARLPSARRTTPCRAGTRR